MLAELPDYFTANEIVECAKTELDIHHSDECMSDAEIAKAMRWVMFNLKGLRSDGRYTRTGLEMLLTLTLLAFPKFYERHGLNQFN